MVKRNAHGQSVVCSELTRSHGKIKSITLAVIAACSVMADASAVTTQGENQTLSPTTSVAIGDGIIATGDSSVAIGDYVKATGNESTAVGTRSTTFGNQSTATGSYAFADGNQSTSNGHAASAMAIDTIAIGVNSGAASDSMSKEDWDKLLIIDREIKELDPNSFTKTVTVHGTPPTAPDRTRLTEAEKHNTGIITTEVARTIEPEPMFYGMIDDLGDVDELANVMNVHLTTQVKGELGSFYTSLLGAGIQFNKGNYELMYAMPRGKSLWTFAETSVSNPDYLLTETARGNKYNTSVDYAVGHYYRLMDILDMDGRTSDFDPSKPPSIAFPTTDEEMAAAEEKYAYLYDAATRAESMLSRETFRSEYSRIKNLAVQNLDQQAIDIAVAFFNGTATQDQVDAYASTSDKVQQLKDAMVVTHVLKQIRTSYTYMNEHVGTHHQVIQTGAGSIGGAYGEEVKTTWDFREVDPNTLFGEVLTPLYASTNRYIEELEVSGGIEAMRTAYNELKAARKEYNTALAEYEAAVAAGGTGGTTTTTTDLAAYEAALAEKRAELTRLANAAGFDGTFESLSDVFGAKKGRAIAIGNQAYVSGDESVGVGYGNTVTGSRSNVLGTHNNVTTANNNVMGNDNNITVSEGNVIVGNAITFAQGVTTSDNIALGSNTVISAPVPTASMDIRGATHDFAGTNPTSVVTIGSEGNERQIQNVAAGRVTNTSTDAINGSQLYAVVEALNAIQTINIDDISDAISTEINITGGDNVQVSREGNNFTISATGTTLTAGDNITVEGDATNGYTIKATNTQSVVKAGNGVTVDVADNDIGTKDYTVSTKIGDGLTFGSNGEIKATGTIINAGDNITVTGDALNGYTISTKGGITDEQLQDVINQINGIVDTNTQSTTSAGQGIVITETDNANGTKNYAVSIKATDGLTFDDNGNIKVSDTLVKAGDNVQVSGNAKDGFTVSAKGTEITAGDNVNVSGDAKNGYTISVESMRTTVTGGQGAEVTSSDNADGSKNYTVNVKVGEGLTYDDKGNLVNDMKLTAGENVQVSGDAKGGYTISATDTNTQATVSADKGITVTETNNANGTKNYAVSAKLGKGLKVDENGAIAATAQPINGGAGVSITTNAQDEAVVNVAGVTTTTDDGKSYTRSDLTKPVGVKGDGKNIRTSTAANGDVQVKLADDVKVNSVTTGNVSISTKGVNAGGKKVTNVAPAEISPTSADAVNGSQLHATNIQVHNNTQNIAKLGDRVNHLDTKVNKVNKEARAGIAGTVATASLPQVYMAGKSMVSAAAGHYKNENAIAVGYSRASDNGKLVFKLNSSANTRGDFTVGTGIGYQW